MGGGGAGGIVGRECDGRIGGGEQGDKGKDKERGRGTGWGVGRGGTGWGGG